MLNLEAAQANYTAVREIVDQWLDERGAYWEPFLSFSPTPPFCAIEQLPNEAISELESRLIEALPAEIVSTADANIKFFSVSGVARLARRKFEGEKQPASDGSTPEPVAQEGDIVTHCPLCGEHHLISVLIPPVGKRHFHCTTCGTELPTRRVGCIRCGNDNAKQQTYLKSENYPGVEVVVCDNCHDIFKEFDLREISVTDYLWKDIETLPLTLAAENWSKTAKENEQEI